MAPRWWDAGHMNGETWMRNRWLHVFFAATMLLTAVITVFGWSP
jgi:hypothetical protein